MGRLAYHPLGPGDWPITSRWRTAHRPGHRGCDVGVSKRPLYAAITGRARRRDEPGGAGWYYEIVSPDGRLVVKTFHMSRRDIADGAQVTAGQVIGISGGVPGEPGAGNTTGAHLHFEIWENGKDTDPYNDLQDAETIGTPPDTNTDQGDESLSAQEVADIKAHVTATAEETRKFLSERIEQSGTAGQAVTNAAIDNQTARLEADDGALLSRVTEIRDEFGAAQDPKLTAIGDAVGVVV